MFLFLNKQIKEKGQVMVTMVIFFISITTIIILGLTNPIISHISMATSISVSKESFYAAEAGIEDVVYRLKMGLPVATSQVLAVGNHSVTTTVVDESGGKIITSIGEANDYFRKIKTTVILGEGVSFHYGLQVGTGGIEMSNNSRVNGNVYSNNKIEGSNGARITGSAYVSNFGFIDNVDIGTSGGDAYADKVTDSNITGNLYCQTGSGNNKSCDTSLPDPPVQDFPVSDVDIDNWKAIAEAGGVINGNVSLSSSSSSLGPVKIVGNLTMTNNYRLTINGTVWVTGKIYTSNGSLIKLSSSYGSGSGILLSDSEIKVSNNSVFQGSGTAGSYVMLLSTYDGGNIAIEIDNNAGAVILNAQKGKVKFSNNAGAKSVSAKSVELDNGATIDYDIGLVNVNFTSGPGGGFDIVGWREI